MTEERLLTAEDFNEIIAKQNEEREKRQREFMEQTLSSVLKKWNEETKNEGRTIWIFADDDPKWRQTFRMDDPENPGVYSEAYVRRLESLGFVVEKNYILKEERGFGPWKKTVREAHWHYTIKLPPQKS